MSTVATRKRLVPTEESEHSGTESPEIADKAKNKLHRTLSWKDQVEPISKPSKQENNDSCEVGAVVQPCTVSGSTPGAETNGQLSRRIAHAVAATPRVPYYAETPTDLGGVSDPLASGDSGWSRMDTPSPETKDGMAPGKAYEGMGENGGEGTSSSATPVHHKRSTSSQFSNRFDFKNWRVSSRYNLQKLLGQGSYGEVALAIDEERLKQLRTESGAQSSAKESENLIKAKVAIKRISNVFDQEIDTKRILREVYILRRLNHVNVIKLLDIVTPADSFNEIYLIFEFIDTDLHKLINSPQYLTVEHIKTFLYQLLRALEYMHAVQVVHRDIKPANILLNESCLLKVCDFGLARVIGTPVQSSEVTEGTGEDQQVQTVKEESPIERPKKPLSRQLTKHVVTRWYRPPELILLQEYSNGVDMWSVGCIFAELLSMQRDSIATFRNRKPLFPGKSCFPLSAENDRTYKDQLDQLNVIFDVIGTPSEEDVSHLGDVQHYLRGLQKKEPTDFAQKYKGAPADAIDLLNKILVFNPSKRVTVKEALQHQFLASVFREEDNPKGTTEHIVVEQVTHLSGDQLKAKLIEEIRGFSGYGTSEPVAHSQKSPREAASRNNSV